MWKPYYRRRFRKKEADPIEGILGLYVMCLALFWITNKDMFWQWLNFGIFVAVIFFVGVVLFKKINNKGGSGQSFIRNIPTLKAQKLGNKLREFGWPVQFEKWDGHKHIDIAIPEAKYNIEVDGRQHSSNLKQVIADTKRDFYSRQKGFETQRVSNSLLENDSSIEEQARLIDEKLKDRISASKKNNFPF